MPIIEVHHLTKEYRLGAMQGLKQSMLNACGRLIGKRAPERPLFKALDDVSFSIEPGEVVGVIGHNGAGKSTLLKMLSKISTPSSGTVKVHGRIAPLIEVGAGFVPDFTGRENVYLNGAILGMSKTEIDRKFDEIVDFAEMAEFIDTPVKRYSSGMQVKLAFAVATSIESEILIVDEVLAVGDLAFQRKCFDRMESLISENNRTVLLVSHNIRQIDRICDRVLLLDHGRIKMDDNARDVCNAFYEQSDRAILIQQRAKQRTNLASTGEAELIEIHLSDESGLRIESVEYGSDFYVTVKIRTIQSLSHPVFVFGIHTTDFVNITTAMSSEDIREQTLPSGQHHLRIRISNCPLLPGTYSARFSIDVEEPVKNIFYGDNLFHFTISSPQIRRTSPHAEGFFLLQTSWGVQSSEVGALPQHL